MTKTFLGLFITWIALFPKRATCFVCGSKCWTHIKLEHNFCCSEHYFDWIGNGQEKTEQA